MCPLQGVGNVARRIVQFAGDIRQGQTQLPEQRDPVKAAEIIARPEEGVDYLDGES